MFEIELQQVVCLFRVTLHHSNHLFIVRHRSVFHYRSSGFGFDLRKKSLQFLLGPVDINVADNNDRLICRTVPFLIEISQFLRLETCNNLHFTNGHSASIFAAGINQWKSFLKNTQVCRVTVAPLPHYHPTLIVNIIIEKKNVRAPVPQNKHT